MKMLHKLSSAVFAFVVATSSASALVLDDFSVAQNQVIDTTLADGGLWSTQVMGAGILGGYRDIYVEFLSVTAGTGLNQQAQASVSDGFYSFSTTSLAIGQAIIRYDGINSGNAIDADGLGGVNLLGGAIGFQLTVLAADLGFEFELHAYTNDTDYSVLTLQSTGPGVYFIPFALFSSPFAETFGAGINFSSVGALQAVLNTATPGTQALDVVLDLVQVVPEPGTLALMGLGLLGLALRRRA